MATALTAIHGAGVIHRDLKTANVLLGPKVIDFGLARLVDPPDAAAQHDTSTGELVGTVAYMAPERIDPIGRELTPAADIFAWGAVLRSPGPGARQLLDRLLTGGPANPRPTRPIEPTAPTEPTRRTCG